MVRRFLWALTLGLAIGCGDSSTQQDASLGDGSVGGDSATDIGSGDSQGSADTLAPGQKRIFVTNATYKGDLGGLSGADQKCQTAAQGAGLGGTWVAWISSTTQDAINRIVDVGPWFRLDGKRVFLNKAAISSPPQNGLWLDETGTFLASDRIWTGTVFDGTVSPLGQTCLDWSSAAMGETAAIGQVGRTDGGNWTNFAATSCDQLAHLICFEQ